MDWKSKTIAITGGAGFIGQSLIAALHSLGVNIYALVRDDDIVNMKRVKQVRGDLRNYEDVERLFYESVPDLLIHLGAVAPIGFGYRAPRQTIATNVIGTTNVLVAARHFGNTPCIIASSDKAYGKPSAEPVTEDTELNPHHPYDASKAAADLIAISFMHTYGLPVYLTRAANVYGPGDDHWSRIIPGCIKAALLDDIFIIRSDGKAVRDYIYIQDVIEAYLSLIYNVLFKGQLLGVWNISAHDRHDVLSIVEWVGKKTIGRKIKYKIMGAAKLEMETDILMVDGNKFMKDFDWKPQVSLGQGLEATVTWVAYMLGFDLGDDLHHGPR